LNDFSSLITKNLFVFASCDLDFKILVLNFGYHQPITQTKRKERRIRSYQYQLWRKNREK